jgi:hypothetical protein
LNTTIQKKPNCFLSITYLARIISLGFCNRHFVKVVLLYFGQLENLSNKITKNCLFEFLLLVNVQVLNKPSCYLQVSYVYNILCYLTRNKKWEKFAIDSAYYIFLISILFFSFRKSQTSFIMNQNEVRGTPNFRSVSKRRKIMSFHQNFQSNRRWIEMSRILSFSVVVIGLMPMCLALSENIVCGSDIQTYVCLHKNYSR